MMYQENVISESEDIEHIIQSILISCKYSLPAHRISKDFFALEGRDIPYKKFG